MKTWKNECVTEQTRQQMKMNESVTANKLINEWVKGQMSKTTNEWMIKQQRSEGVTKWHSEWWAHQFVSEWMMYDIKKNEWTNG